MSRPPSWAMSCSSCRARRRRLRSTTSRSAVLIVSRFVVVPSSIAAAARASSSRSITVRLMPRPSMYTPVCANIHDRMYPHGFGWLRLRASPDPVQPCPQLRREHDAGRRRVLLQVGDAGRVPRRGRSGPPSLGCPCSDGLDNVAARAVRGRGFRAFPGPGGSGGSCPPGPRSWRRTSRPRCPRPAAPRSPRAC